MRRTLTGSRPASGGGRVGLGLGRRNDHFFAGDPIRGTGDAELVGGLEGVDQPLEDEFALMKTTLVSPILVGNCSLFWRY